MFGLFLKHQLFAAQKMSKLNNNSIDPCNERKIEIMIQFTLNGKAVQVDAEEEDTLLWAIRSRLDLTGTKYGCGLGQCGACTVLVNGKAARSCMLTMDFVAGKEIITIEGLEKDGELNPVQQAFVNHDALQCGYCTSGMIMNAYSLLLSNPNPTDAEIIDEMEENLCRCGTYNRVILAIKEAGEKMKGGVKL